MCRAAWNFPPAVGTGTYPIDGRPPWPSVIGAVNPSAWAAMPILKVTADRWGQYGAKRAD
jgi:hypothetical protein